MQVSLCRTGLPLMAVGTLHVTRLQSPAPKLAKSSPKCPRKSGASLQVILSGSWVFGSLPSTMKFCSAYTVDHCTRIIEFNPQRGLLSLAVLFLGLLSVYSLCCKKKGNNWIATSPVGQENLEGRNWVSQGMTLPIEGQAANNGTESKPNILH